MKTPKNSLKLYYTHSPPNQQPQPTNQHVAIQHCGQSTAFTLQLVYNPFLNYLQDAIFFPTKPS